MTSITNKMSLVYLQRLLETFEAFKEESPDSAEDVRLQSSLALLKYINDPHTTKIFKEIYDITDTFYWEEQEMVELNDIRWIKANYQINKRYGALVSHCNKMKEEAKFLCELHKNVPASEIVQMAVKKVMSDMNHAPTSVEAQVEASAA